MALEIDRDCHELHNDAIDIKHHDGIEEEDVSGSVPQSWAKFSKNNVEESQCEYSAYFLLHTPSNKDIWFLYQNAKWGRISLEIELIHLPYNLKPSYHQSHFLPSMQSSKCQCILPTICPIHIRIVAPPDGCCCPNVWNLLKANNIHNEFPPGQVPEKYL